MSKTTQPLVSDERNEMVAEGLLTVREAGEFLRLSRSKVYELMDAGALAFVRLGRCRRIPRLAVVLLAARNLQGGTKA